MKIEHRSPSVEEYRNLRRLVGWWDTEEEATALAFANSLFSVVALEGERIVGLGRIIGDGGLNFYIQDLIIHPEFQGKGFGRQLMAELMSYIKANAKPGAFIGLMAAKGLEKYYTSFGFKSRDPDAPGMFQVVGNISWSAKPRSST